MKKRIPLGAVIAMVLFAVALTFSITMYGAMNVYNKLVKNVSERSNMYDSLSELDRTVREHYLNAVDESRLNEGIGAGYIKGLGDESSEFMTAEEYKEYLQSLRGRTQGMGMETAYYEPTGYAYIVRVYDNSPAKAAGLQTGDQILTIDGKSVKDLGYEKSVELLSGAAGTHAKVQVQRNKSMLTLSVSRAQVEIQSVYWEEVNGVGYVKITRFAENTAGQFRSAVEELEKKKVASYLFDVRDNEGGSLTAVADIIDQLVPTGTIVSAEYRDGTVEALKTSDAKDISKPMIVLINEGTASGAELFACDLKDFGKAQLVGVTTQGKGRMQQVFALSDGSAVNLTVAKFIPYLSANFDDKGIAPDVEAKLSKAQKESAFTFTTKNDPQIQEALSILGVQQGD